MHLTGTSRGETQLSAGRRLGSLFRVNGGAEKVTFANLTLNEGAGVGLGMVVLEGKNSEIAFRNVAFNGSHEVGTRSAAALFGAHDWVQDVSIVDSAITKMGYGINIGANARNILVSRCEFVGWQYYAVRVSPGAHRSGERSTSIVVEDNTMAEPAVGPAGQAVILISRGWHRAFTTDVTVSGNRIQGPGVPYVRTTADSTNALGDTIVLHGVNGFTVRENRVSGGGENGITISRLSRNGVVSQNTVFDDDAFGLNIGSGYYEVTVEDPAGFSVGDEVHGSESGTFARVENIFGNVLALNPVSGGKIFRNEALDNMTSGQSNAGEVTLVTRTQGIEVEDNWFYNNAANKAQELSRTWEVIVMNSDSIRFSSNVIYSERYSDPTQHNLIHLLNSRNISVADTNELQHGNRTVDTALTKTRSSWLTHQ